MKRFEPKVILRDNISTFIRSNIARNNTITGLSELENAIQLFPNPTSDYVQIKLENNKHGKYFLHTLTGRLIEAGDLTGCHQIEMTNKSPGTYLITLETNSGSFSKRIVKQ